MENKNINNYVNINKIDVDNIKNLNVNNKNIDKYVNNYKIDKNLIDDYDKVGIINTKYDIIEYLNRIKELDEQERRLNLRAYKNYSVCNKIVSSGVSLDKAERTLYGSKNMSDNEIIKKIIDEYYVLSNSSTMKSNKLDKLITKIKNIASSVMSTKTKYKLIKHEIAFFALENGLDCYLFSANIEIFDDLYSKVMLLKRKGR